jgi:hypothetical protein
MATLFLLLKVAAAATGSIFVAGAAAGASAQRNFPNATTAISDGIRNTVASAAGLVSRLASIDRGKQADTIIVRCRHCGQKLRIERQRVGAARCPVCGEQHLKGGVH